MQLSDFGQAFSAPSGISELMADLGEAFSGGHCVAMMGGGNPAHITDVEQVWQRRFGEILSQSGQLESLLGDYDSPSGNSLFVETLADFFNRNFQFGIGPENICVTSGSQTAFFMLFNLLAGPTAGKMGKILFPLVPEYIGYSSQGITPGIFTSRKPVIAHLDERRFKYRIDFEHLDVRDDIAAICLSRPTNPTANVITDNEIDHLLKIVEQRNIYLMIDNAYGAPFPNVIFRETTLRWHPRMILSFSLSKLGLPGTRTGIVVADKEIIRRLAAMNSSLSLSNGSIGQAITQPLFASDEILTLCRESVLPFYRQRKEGAERLLAQYMDPTLDYHIHTGEGAFFLWLWFRDLPISDRELYSRLKARGVMVIPGSYFFPGLETPWQHRHECLRISYCQSDAILERGIRILAEEVARAYAGS